MFQKAKPIFIKVVTPLHAGSGDELGVIDLPIQREKHTNYPKIESSSLKGSIREAFERRIKKEENKNNYHNAINLAFGPESSGDHAGALGFTDARILFFPVKSLKGVFAYITSPSVLKRFKEDLDMCNLEDKKDIEFPSVGEGKCITNSSKILLNENKLILEEYCFDAEKSSDNFINSFLDKCNLEDKTKNEIKEHLVILSDEDFKDFVTLSTEVITRIKINNETGVVQDGALWTEEYLPSESILYSLVLTTPIFNSDKGIFETEKNKSEEIKSEVESEEDKVMTFFETGVPEVMQIGGNATLGKGIVKIIKLEAK